MVEVNLTLKMTDAASIHKASLFLADLISQVPPIMAEVPTPPPSNFELAEQQEMTPALLPIATTEVPVSAFPVEVAAITPTDTDINGMPWDERIHSSSHAKLKEGAWKYKKGVSPDLIASVEQELRGAPTLSLPPPPPQTPPPPSPAGAGISFIDVVTGINKNKVTTEAIQAALAKFGIDPPTLMGLASKPEKFELVAKEKGVI